MAKRKHHTASELATLIPALHKNLVQARAYVLLLRGLQESIPRYETIFNTTRVFWGTVFGALSVASYICLSRVYDQHPTALHLKGLLEIIRDNPHIFTEQEFRERVDDDEYVDRASSDGYTPDPECLKNDIALTSDSDPLVYKIVLLRGSSIAHTGLKVSLGQGEHLDANALTDIDVDHLIERAYEIFNRYVSLFNASTYANFVFDEGDYKSLLDLLDRGDRAMNEDLEETFRQASE